MPAMLPLQKAVKPCSLGTPQLSQKLLETQSKMEEKRRGLKGQTIWVCLIIRHLQTGASKNRVSILAIPTLIMQSLQSYLQVPGAKQLVSLRVLIFLGSVIFYNNRSQFIIIKLNLRIYWIFNTVCYAFININKVSIYNFQLYIQIMSEKQMKKNQPEDDNDELNKALDDFNENLNVTDEQVKPDLIDDPDTEAKIKQEYEKFMKQMQNIGLSGQGGDDGMQNLTSMLSGLLNQLSGESGLEGVIFSIKKDKNEMTKGFEEMFKTLKQQNIEQAAGKLLSQFMDKNILYEPLVQAKQHYEDYFKKQEGKIPKEDQERYRKQYMLLSEIVTNLESTHEQTQEQKDQLIEMFEKMQQLGQPPEGISAPGQFI